MKQMIEYVVAGGSRHGSVFTVFAADEALPPPPMTSSDGGIYTAAAYRRAPGSPSTRIVLLHPKATGKEFLAMLAEASRHEQRGTEFAVYAG